MNNASKTDSANDSTWLRLVRGYTFNFPLNKGKMRVANLAKKFCRTFPQNVVTPTKDGRLLSVSFRDWAEDMIYFLGTYETFCTNVVSRHIKSGDLCLDVGANIGWYSTLFRRICGANGAVHSFEPVPNTFSELQKNIALNDSATPIFLNNFGLGDTEKDLEINFFPDLPSGHATLATDSNEKTIKVPVKIKTLNDYLTEKNIRQVDFVKVDIEGAEMMFLQGATKLFEQQRPPILFMEMALETSRAFGHIPNDLLVFISRHADYDFFALDELNEKLNKIEHFAPDDIGANVLCIPKNR